MKIFTIKNLTTIASCVMFSLALLVSTSAFAGHAHVKHWKGWQKVSFNDRGHHNGHHNRHGHHNGLHKEHNRWCNDNDDDDASNTDTGSGDTGTGTGTVVTGVPVDLTVNDPQGLHGGAAFNVTYDSLTTVQQVLTDLEGTSGATYGLQMCYQFSDPLAGTYTDCTTGETLTPLDTSLTLDAAGLVADPVVYLVKLP